MKREVCIGLNYAGSSYELPDCHIDANAIALRSRAAGFCGDIHTGVFGINDFLAEHERIRVSAKKSDTTLISYSGHGTQWNDATSAERDKMEEGLCFWNGENIEVLPDDDFRMLVEKIPGTVIVLLDSCFSGGMSRLVKTSAIGRSSEKTPRFIPFAPSFRIHRPTQARNLIQAVLGAGNKLYFLLSSQEEEVSWSTGQGGLFTRFFCDQYDFYSKSKRTIKRLMSETLKNCTPDQNPKYDIYAGSASKRLF